MIFLLILAATSSNCASRHPLHGYWQGTMSLNQHHSPITLHFSAAGGTISCPEIAFHNVALKRVQHAGNQVTFTIPDIDSQLRFSAVLRKDQLAGSARIDVNAGRSLVTIGFRVSRLESDPPRPPYAIEKHAIPSGKISLDVHIYRPDRLDRHPAMVLLPGSNSRVKQDVAFFADFFARLGVEVLIFDKRGSGGSTGDYETATYDDFAADAIACLQVLKSRPGVDPKQIGLWGTSQGATLLPLIAARSAIPSFLIADSPEAGTVAQSSAFQDSLRLIRLGYSRREADIAAASHHEVAAMIGRQATAQEVESFIRENSRKHLFMNQTALHDRIRITPAAYAGFYWADRVTDFTPFWQRLAIDALVVYGEEDNLVDARKNQALLAGMQSSRIHIRMFSGVGHVMKKAIDPLTAKPETLDWPKLEPRYLALLKEWIAARCSQAQ